MSGFSLTRLTSQPCQTQISLANFHYLINCLFSLLGGHEDEVKQEIMDDLKEAKEEVKETNKKVKGGDSSSSSEDEGDSQVVS